MSNMKFAWIVAFFLTYATVRCDDYGSGDSTNPYELFGYRNYYSCERETRTALAEIKSQIRDLHHHVTSLRQMVDPDFKKTTTPKPESKCPPGFHYLPKVRTCLKVVYKELNWTSADQSCRGLNSRAHLAAIKTRSESIAMKSYLRWELSKNAHINVCTFHHWGDEEKKLWTSGQRLNETDCTSPFVWKVSDDKHLPLQTTDWAEGEPNCAGESGEHCLHLRPRLGYQWNDLSCDKAICPLCQYDPE